MSSVTFFANSVPLSFNGLGIGEYVFSQLSKVFYENNSAHFGNIFLIFWAAMITSIIEIVKLVTATTSGFISAT